MPKVTEITQITGYENVNNNDLVIITQGGQTRVITIEQLKLLFAGGEIELDDYVLVDNLPEDVKGILENAANGVEATAIDAKFYSVEAATDIKAGGELKGDYLKVNVRTAAPGGEVGTASLYYNDTEGKLYFVNPQGVVLPIDTASSSTGGGTGTGGGGTGGGNTDPNPNPPTDVFQDGSTIFTDDGTSLAGWDSVEESVVDDEVEVASGKLKMTYGAIGTTSTRTGVQVDKTGEGGKAFRFKYNLDAAATLSGEHTLASIYHSTTEGWSDFVQIRIKAAETTLTKYMFVVTLPDPTGPQYNFNFRIPAYDEYTKGTEYCVELYIDGFEVALSVGTSFATLKPIIRSKETVTNIPYELEGKEMSVVTLGRFYSTGLQGIEYFDDIKLLQDYVYPTAPATVAAAYANVWSYYKKRYILDNGAVKRPWPDGKNTANQVYMDNVSEGTAYMQLLAVQMNDQATFDLLEAFAYGTQEQRHYTTPNPDHLLAWHINPIDGTHISPFGDDGKNFASDADIDRATALIWAHERWGSGGTINYQSRANAVLADLKTYSHFTVNSKNYLAPYENYSVGDYRMINPSYFPPAQYKVFKDFSADVYWDNARAAVYEFLGYAQAGFTLNDGTINGGAGVTNGATGLVPNWAMIKNNLASDIRPGHTNDPNAINYTYDAFRIVLRVYWDKLWFSNTSADPWLGGKLSTFYQNQWTNNQRIAAEYELDGDAKYGGYEKTMMTYMAYFSMLADGAMGASATDIYNKKLSTLAVGSFAGLYAAHPAGSFLRDNSVTTTKFQGKTGYFSDMLVLLAALTKDNLMLNYT